MIEIWYAILAFMLVMFVVLEGFDIGAGMLQYVVGKTEAERRLVIAAIGPLWSWHEVWLVGFRRNAAARISQHPRRVIRRILPRAVSAAVGADLARRFHRGQRSHCRPDVARGVACHLRGIQSAAGHSHRRGAGQCLARRSVGSRWQICARVFHQLQSAWPGRHSGLVHRVGRSVHVDHFGRARRNGAGDEN